MNLMDCSALNLTIRRVEQRESSASSFAPCLPCQKRIWPGSPDQPLRRAEKQLRQDFRESVIGRKDECVQAEGSTGTHLLLRDCLGCLRLAAVIRVRPQWDGHRLIAAPLPTLGWWCLPVLYKLLNEESAWPDALRGEQWSACAKRRWVAQTGPAHLIEEGQTSSLSMIQPGEGREPIQAAG